jgi:hypothetical protein
MATQTTPKKSMQNVVAPVDPATQGGSLAGTMPATNATPQAAAAAPMAAAAPDNVPKELSEDDWYNLLHNLGSAMQRANPDIEAVLKQMSPDIDYEGQAAALKKKIESRQTPGQMPWWQAAAGSMTPQGAAIVQHRQDYAKSEEDRKAADLEKLQENLTMQHIGSLQQKGKFHEALATMLLQKGINEASARNRAAEAAGREKLRAVNAINVARERAKNLADTFHFDERMRLKMMEIAGKIAESKLQKYGGLDPLTGGFTIKPDMYEKWQDETMAEMYAEAAKLRAGGSEAPVVGGTGVTGKGTPQTNHGKAKADPLGLR